MKGIGDHSQKSMTSSAEIQIFVWVGVSARIILFVCYVFAEVVLCFCDDALEFVLSYEVSE